jgi:hypothetical protein
MLRKLTLHIVFCLCSDKKCYIDPYYSSTPAYFSLVCSREQQLADVEAKNSVSYRWVPETWGASGTTGYVGSLEILRPVLFWERESGNVAKEVM